MRAMAGLKYDSGLVEIDEAVAAKIVAGRDAQQAAAEFAAGRELLEQGLFVEAIAAHTRAVLLDPESAEYYDGLGVALITRGRVEQALAAYRTCLKLDGSRLETRLRVGYALQMLGRLDEAVAEWLQVVEQQPGHGEAHSRLAIGYYYLGDYHSAWTHTHAAEAAGFPVPPQFRELLSARLAEPG
jgi:Flp pilus assembly protein TadD